MSILPPFYVISDTHFFHNNIVKFCDRHEQIDRLLERDPSYYERLGAKVVDHNVYMVDRWNEVVGHDDIVLHLGDVALWRGDGIARYQASIQPRLNGKKYLIPGNHDRDDIDWMALGFEEVLKPFFINYKGYEVSFDHYPLPAGVLHPERKQVHIHGHIHNNGYPKFGAVGQDVGRTSPMQVNVSVEEIDYTPQSLDSLLRPYVG